MKAFRKSLRLIYRQALDYIQQVAALCLSLIELTPLFDSSLSKVFQQAENRMWAQNAVLVSLFSESVVEK